MKKLKSLLGVAAIGLATLTSAQAQTNTTSVWSQMLAGAKAWATSDPVKSSTNWDANVGMLLSKPVGATSRNFGMYAEALVPVTAQSKFGFGIYEPNTANIYDGTISYQLNDTKSTSIGDFTLGAEVMTLLNLTTGNPAAGGFVNGDYDYYITPNITIGADLKWGYIESIKQVLGFGLHGSWSF